MDCNSYNILLKTFPIYPKNNMVMEKISEDVISIKT